VSRENAKLPEVYGFLTIFTRPGKVFARVRQRQTWVAAFLGSVFLLALPTVAVISTSGIELLTLQRYQHNPKLMAEVGGESGVERAVDSSNEHWTKLLVVSRVAGVAAVELALLAAAFTLGITFLDKRPNFFTMMGTVCYAVFPFAFLGLVISLILLAINADQSSLDLENMPALNIARLLDRADSSPAIYSMALQMDILLGGEILFVSFGLTKVAKVTYIQALALCGCLWMLAVSWKAVWVSFM
jgi:hypothetical protein